jgi:tetratricopeptide (TPR) repeat protein
MSGVRHTHPGIHKVGDLQNFAGHIPSPYAKKEKSASLFKQPLMKKLLLVIECFALIVAAHAQPAKKKFAVAVALYNEKNYDSALLIFHQIYKKGSGDPSLLAKAHFNIAQIYLEKKDTITAKKVFHQVLVANYNEMDSGGFGQGLMAEPYSLYGNNTCKILAEIALAEKQYKEALEYTRLFTEEYPYRHFCGNEYEADAIYTAYTYGRCYEGLGDMDKAISAMLPYVIYTGLASNSYLVDTLCVMIKKRYSEENIREELTRALSSIRQRNKKKPSQSEYYTVVFDVEIPVSAYSERGFLFRKEFTDMQYRIHNFRNSLFYCTLMGLAPTDDIPATKTPG